MPGAHQCHQDMSVFQLGHHAFCCQVLEGFGLEAEGRGAFKNKFVPGAVAGGPVVVGSRPCGHVRRLDGMLCKAGHQHGHYGGPAAVDREGIAAAVGIIGPAGIRLVIIGQSADAGSQGQSELSCRSGRIFQRLGCCQISQGNSLSACVYGRLRTGNRAVCAGNPGSIS